MVAAGQCGSARERQRAWVGARTLARVRPALRLSCAAVKHYAVAELDVTDPAWVRDYVAEVTPLVESYGGRYLARSVNVDRIEGEQPAPQVLLLIEWPSREAADAFYASEEYRPHREARRHGARNRFLIVTGEDVNGVADIAP